MRKYILIFIIGALVAGGGFLFFTGRGENLITKLFGPDVPTAVPYQPSPSVSIPTLASPKLTPQLAQEINLDIPFTSQAPHRNWELPYKEFCEEASSLMAISYVTGQTIPNADFANAKMLEIKAFEEKRFGYYEDTTAEETAIILKEFYKYPKVKIVANPSITDIKTALSQSKAVIVPAAGRKLAALPVHPRLGVMLRRGGELGLELLGDVGTAHGPAPQHVQYRLLVFPGNNRPAEHFARILGHGLGSTENRQFAFHCTGHVRNSFFTFGFQANRP